MEDSDFKNQNGELVGYIPDTSDEINDTIGNRQGDVGGADVAAVIGSVNANANKVIKYNSNYNLGFTRRMKLYNRGVWDNDTYREIELFIPLNRIFSFCGEFNRVLKYIPLEIILTRSGFNTRCFFGAADTSVNFAEDDNGGLQSIRLQLERIKFRPDIEADLEKAFKKPFNASYYKRICEQSSTTPETRTTFSHMKTVSNSDDGSVKFVFCVIKKKLMTLIKQIIVECVMLLYHNKQLNTKVVNM